MLKAIIPITASIKRHREDFTRPAALEEVQGRPVIASAIDSLRDLLERASVTFIALAEHEDRLDVSGKLRGLLGTKGAQGPAMVVLRQAPGGELETVLRVRSELRDDDELLIARGDRAVRSELAKHLDSLQPGGASSSKDVRAIVSVIGARGVPSSVVQAEEGVFQTSPWRVRQVTPRTTLGPLLPTGLCWFAKAGEFLAAADSTVQRGVTPEARARILEHAEPVEVCNDYVGQHWSVETCPASELRYLDPLCSAALSYGYERWQVAS